MRGLAAKIVTIIVDDYGVEEFLKRLSDTFWFQSLGCCLGYDWHSSGVTTVVTSVLKAVIEPESHGLAVAGGKGRYSRKAPNEIEEMRGIFGWSEERVASMKYASRMSAKVDNSAIQAGFPLYHHAFFVSEKGKWVVIQQGMCGEKRSARRYHWHSERVDSYVNEPHKAIVCDVVRENALNMTAKESEECRKSSIDLVNDGPRHLKRLFNSIRPEGQGSLDKWLPEKYWERTYRSLSMPWNVNWKTLEQVYEIQLLNYEELLSIKGVGPTTVKGLAYVSEIVHGRGPSWNDPVKFSFAYGGKDGVPRPVDRRAMDESIFFLKEALEEAEIGREEKLNAFRRLGRLTPNK